MDSVRDREGPAFVGRVVPPDDAGRAPLVPACESVGGTGAAERRVPARCVPELPFTDADRVERDGLSEPGRDVAVRPREVSGECEGNAFCDIDRRVGIDAHLEDGMW